MSVIQTSMAAASDIFLPLSLTLIFLSISSPSQCHCSVLQLTDDIRYDIKPVFWLAGKFGDAMVVLVYSGITDSLMTFVGIHVCEVSSWMGGNPVKGESVEDGNGYC